MYQSRLYCIIIVCIVLSIIIYIQLFYMEWVFSIIQHKSVRIQKPNESTLIICQIDVYFRYTHVPSSHMHTHNLSKKSKKATSNVTNKFC